MKRTPSVGQLARQATSRAARRSWQRLQKVHPYRMQQIITAIFIAIVLGVAIKSGVKAVQRWRKCRPDPLDDSLGYTDPVFPRSTAYTRSPQLKRTPDACAEAANFPQVALLLLTKGEVPHEEMWRQWFTQAVGKLPLEAAKSTLCSDTINTNASTSNTTYSPQEIYAACSGNVPKTGSLENLISRQHLFDVWIHPAVNFPGFPKESAFHGRELPREFRVQTVWGTHTIIDATRALLAAALTNPRAEKFVLMSESDVPLYSPMALYTQMMTETRSRVNACNNTGAISPEEEAARGHIAGEAAAGGALSTTEVCSAPSQVHLYRPLGPQCPLLARKFLNNTVNAVLATLLPCSGGLGIVNDAENCNTNFAKKQQSLLAKLDLNFPPEDDDEPTTIFSRIWNSSSSLFIISFFSFLAAVLGWTLRKRAQRNKRLPLSHSESFHTALKHYGVIE